MIGLASAGGGHHRSANVPGLVTSLSSPSTTSTSVTLSWVAPATGGALNYGAYQVQYQIGAGSFVTYPTSVQYCTVGTGTSPNSATDGFGNVWAIGPTGPNGVYVNNTPVPPTNNVTQVIVIGNTVYQFGGGAWYSQTATQNYGTTPPTGGAGGGFNPAPAAPLSAVVISGLTASTSYNFQVRASNSSGFGAWTASLPVTTAALPTITSIVLSNTSFAATTAPPVTVGAITVNMSSGSFTGTVSENSANFAVSSASLPSNLVTSASLAAGTYSDTITATMGGVSNSPFSQTISNLTATTVTAFQVWNIFDFNNWTSGRSATNNAITSWGSYVGGSGSQTWAGFNGELDSWLNVWVGISPRPTYGQWSLMLLDGSSTFAQVAAGNFDSHFQYFVTRVASVTGLTRFGCRLGWEMNLGWPWNASGNPTGFAQAFAHIYDVIKAQAAATGVGVDVAWCPGAGNVDPRPAMYPGDAHVDWLSMDFGAGGNINDITGNGGWSFASMADASINGFNGSGSTTSGKGKQINVAEGEIPVNNPNFNPANQYPNYCTAMSNVLTSTGAKLPYYNVYDSTFGANQNNVPWGNATAVNALNSFIATAAGFKGT